MKKIIVKVLFRLGLLKFFNLSVSVNSIYIPVLGGLGYGNIIGTEKWMTNLLEKILPFCKGSFLDVGVNIGQTLVKVRSLNNNIDYIGFEPNPLCVFYAEKLIAENSFVNTSIIPAGISNENAIVTLKFHEHYEGDSSATIIDNFRNEENLKEKNVVVLQNQVLKFGKKIGLIKIDVEGAELEVLHGLCDVIKSDYPIILIEILPVYSAGNTKRLSRQNEIEKLIKLLNYNIFRIIKGDDGSLKSLKRLNEIGIHGKLIDCDYILLPEHNENMLLAQFAIKII